jgi:hypothetical protein
LQNRDGFPDVDGRVKPGRGEIFCCYTLLIPNPAD